MVVFVAYMYMSGTPAIADRPRPAIDIASSELVLPMRDAPRLGSSSSGVAMVEFSDFECPFCRRYNASTFDFIRSAFIDTGKILYVFKHLPLDNHPNARYAAEIAECAKEQQKFWPFKTVLFKTTTALSRELVSDAAMSVGLDDELLGECIPTATARVDADVADASSLEIRTTPAFVFGRIEGETIKLTRRINGAHPPSVFEEVLASFVTE
jgi:protein-disulfide isomerase